MHGAAHTAAVSKTVYSVNARFAVTRLYLIQAKLTPKLSLFSKSNKSLSSHRVSHYYVI